MTTVHGHFGEWLQGRLGPNGPVGLITLPCPLMTVTVPGQAPLPFPSDALNRFAGLLGLSFPTSGADRSFPLGAGGGGSTATLVALARAAGFDGAPEVLAQACITTEGASDPLMFDAPDRLLWASREGRIVQHLPSPPQAEILGGLWGAPEYTDPQDDAFDDISDLIAPWVSACEDKDLTQIASLASQSANRCSTRRGTAGPMEALAKDLGALGWMRAHTGSARGLIFAPGTMPAKGRTALQEAGLTHVLHFETGAA